MAYLLSTSNGNWTSASTWSVADGTNFTDSRALSSALIATPAANTPFSWSSSAPTLQGLAVQLSFRSIAGTGTMTAELYNSTGSVSVRSVTVNVSDLCTTFGVVGPMWVYFKFSSAVTLATGTNYTIRLSSSTTSQVSCYATAGTNWSYALITTTNQAPTTNDSIIVTGTHTGASSFTGSNVIMDNTSATQFGNIYISNYGNLFTSVATSTNFQLANNGVAGTAFIVGYGGSFGAGAGLAGSFLPASSSLTITLNCSSALSTPLLVYGSFISGSYYNNPGGSGIGKPFNKLAGDVTVGATGSTLNDSTTGWKSGDQIVVPSTTRTASQYEVITLNADQSGTSISHSAYVNAHGGDSVSLVQADLGNITRNIIIKSGSTTFRSNIQATTNSTVWLYGVKLQDLGTAMAATTAGVGVVGLSVVNGGSFQMSCCVMLNTVTNSTTLSGTGLFTTNDTNTSIFNNIFYNLGWTALAGANSIYGMNDSNMFIGNYSSTYACTSTYCGSTTVFASNTATTAAYSGGFYTNSSYNSYYSNSANGIYFVGNLLSTGMYYFSIWRNGATGLILNNAGTTFPRTLTWDLNVFYIFGNATYGVAPIAAVYTRIYFYGGAIWGGSTLVQQYGFFPNAQYIDNILFYATNFGYDYNFNPSPHTTANLFTPTRQASVQWSNCGFNGVEIAGQTPASQGSNSQSLCFTSISHNSSGLNKQWLLNGTISGDNVIFNTTSPSIRMTPLSASFKLCTATIKVPIKNGFSCTISLYVRKSVAGDGAAYNGNAPRLMWVYNPGLGNLAETAVATSVGAAGSWELLTYTTSGFTYAGVAEFYVDCDGTLGWVNVDDIKASYTGDTRGTDFTAPNGVYIEADNRNPGGSYGFTL